MYCAMSFIAQHEAFQNRNTSSATEHVFISVGYIVSARHNHLGYRQNAYCQVQ